MKRYVIQWEDADGTKGGFVYKAYSPVDLFYGLLCAPNRRLLGRNLVKLTITLGKRP